MEFTKMHGLGNDFVLINGFCEEIPSDLAKLSYQMCQPHFGIGADGVIFLLPPQGEEDFIMRIFNNDGSEAEMCGNGIRCAALFAWEEGFCRQEEMTVRTGAGLLKPKLFFDNQGRPEKVRVDMGEPRLAAADIPVLLDGQTILQYPIMVGGKKERITCVSMGNPHCVIFVDDVEAVPVTEYGPKLENHPLFPAKTNVEFVEVLSSQKLKMRVWERACGVTLACGTGSCATAVAARLCGYTGDDVEVELPGGSLEISYQPGGHVFMCGPAEAVFRGAWLK
jgi:diaminopimelate epimerase